jgi:hypothetical protein
VSGASGRQGRNRTTKVIHPEGLTVTFIGVCMKVGVASFPIFFAIALLFPPPNLLSVQQHEDLTGAADPYTDVFVRACTF